MWDCGLGMGWDWVSPGWLGGSPIQIVTRSIWALLQKDSTPSIALSNGHFFWGLFEHMKYIPDPDLKPFFESLVKPV